MEYECERKCEHYRGCYTARRGFQSTRKCTHYADFSHRRHRAFCQCATKSNDRHCCSRLGEISKWLIHSNDFQQDANHQIEHKYARCGYFGAYYQDLPQHTYKPAYQKRPDIIHNLHILPLNHNCVRYARNRITLLT